MDAGLHAPPARITVLSYCMKVIQEDYLHAIEVAQERVNRCEKAMQELLADWQLRRSGSSDGIQRISNSRCNDPRERDRQYYPLPASPSYDGLPRSRAF